MPTKSIAELGSSGTGRLLAGLASLGALVSCVGGDPAGASDVVAVDPPPALSCDAIAAWYAPAVDRVVDTTDPAVQADKQLTLHEATLLIEATISPVDSTLIEALVQAGSGCGLADFESNPPAVAQYDAKTMRFIALWQVSGYDFLFDPAGRIAYNLNFAEELRATGNAPTEPMPIPNEDVERIEIVDEDGSITTVFINPDQ